MPCRTPIRWTVILTVLTTGCLCQDFSGRDTINVRTVLFRDSDANRGWWSLEDINLLIARKLMQDLLPRKLPTDFDKVSNYVKMALETVRNKSPTESTQCVSLAAHDVLGGYLKTVVIPILNEAYYAGNVGYNTAAEVHYLYGRIMAQLRTDGSGWSGPIDMRRIPTKVRSLKISLMDASQACNSLEIRPPEISGRGISRISIPYLDDNSFPNAVAVPLKGNSLFSLMSNCSYNLLPKFYILGMRCLSTPSFNKKDVITFNHEFYNWIVSSVVPHLQESNRWYPGFGGVMRIVETMNQRGLSSDEPLPPNTLPANNTIVIGESFDEFADDPSNIPWIIASIILFVFLTCCCCLYICKSCSAKPEEDESNEGLAKTLVSIYCGVKDTIIGKSDRCSTEDNKSTTKMSEFDRRRNYCYTSEEPGNTTENTSGE